MPGVDNCKCIFYNTCASKTKIQVQRRHNTNSHAEQVCTCPHPSQWRIIIWLWTTGVMKLNPNQLCYIDDVFLADRRWIWIFPLPWWRWWKYVCVYLSVTIFLFRFHNTHRTTKGVSPSLWIPAPVERWSRWGRLRCLSGNAEAEKRKEIINTVLASGCGLQTSEWAVGGQWTGSDVHISLQITWDHSISYKEEWKSGVSCSLRCLGVLRCCMLSQLTHLRSGVSCNRRCFTNAQIGTDSVVLLNSTCSTRVHVVLCFLQHKFIGKKKILSKIYRLSRAFFFFLQYDVIFSQTFMKSRFPPSHQPAFLRKTAKLTNTFSEILC